MRTQAATDARKLQEGEDTQKIRIRGTLELFDWLDTMSPIERGSYLMASRRDDEHRTGTVMRLYSLITAANGELGSAIIGDPDGNVSQEVFNAAGEGRWFTHDSQLEVLTQALEWLLTGDVQEVSLGDGNHDDENGYDWDAA